MCAATWLLWAGVRWFRELSRDAAWDVLCVINVSTRKNEMMKNLSRQFAELEFSIICRHVELNVCAELFVLSSNVYSSWGFKPFYTFTLWLLRVRDSDGELKSF